MSSRSGILGLTGALLASAAYLPTAAAATPCQSLTSLTLPDGAIFNTSGVNGTGATDVAPGSTINRQDGQSPLTLTGNNAVNQSFCRVTIVVPNDNGTFTPSGINIEVWLPETNWNERYEGVGGGGYAGTISSLVPALNANFAAASTDTGHVGGSGTFVLNADDSLNFGLAVDFATRSLHELALQSKFIINAFYGQQPQYSYWNGCSTGGRQGLIEAQDHPDDYDGIWAGSPAVSFDRLSDAQLWPAVVMNLEVGGAGISQTKLNAANAAAVAACDAQDGVVDGVIGDPRACHFDPAALVCGAKGAPTDGTCLLPQEATAIRKIWDGPREVDRNGNPTGPRLWYPLERGASFSVLGGTNATAILPFSIPNVWFQDWLEQNPAFDWHTITYKTFEDDFFFSEKRWTDIIASDNPDLSAFRRRGGKVIITHGWADQIIPSMNSIGYYNGVLRDPRNGGSRKKVEDFARLFMLPGMAHCGGGNGPNVFDAFGAVVNWRETGVAPDQIIASRVVGGQTVETRPLCPYPQVARYIGTGDTNVAANFRCVEERDNDLLNVENAIVPNPFEHFDVGNGRDHHEARNDHDDDRDDHGHGNEQF
ncbi:MAG TPA: tannase/feruloyl esterase family alpha/beta hydrolase [Stellaceae bacterium]|nr:tannase/feruloyl esterase family alpha/beta hydrolase [Stellaceae bacterium]